MIRTVCPACGGPLSPPDAGSSSIGCPVCRWVDTSGSATLGAIADSADSALTLPRFATSSPDSSREHGAEPSAALAPTGYAILAELGRGGMGVVYKARHAKLQREVALKMILAGGHAGTSELNRFRTEAEAIARLQHPHIVQVFEVGEQGGLPFLSLEYCVGGSLEARLDGTPLSPEQAADLIEPLASAMQVAHQARIIHRDLKPSNVLLTGDGRPKITDFGLAKKLDEQGATETGSIIGTPSYMAPEQAEGRKDIGPAADIYALGAILYECMTGRPPFKAATSLDTILQVMRNEPAPPSQLNPKVPRDLETICCKCLQKDPRKRYATAGDLAADLRRWRMGEPIQARPVGRFERAVKWVRRNPAVAALLFLVVLLLSLGTALSIGFGVQARHQAEQARDHARRAEQNEQQANAHALQAEENARRAELKEREAEKMAALAQERERQATKAREEVESTLIEGLLRPVSSSRGPLTPVEVEVFSKLSSLSSDQVRLRFLETALTEPQAAQAFARSELITQACVGIDSQRRLQARNLVLERLQRSDTSANLRKACVAVGQALRLSDPAFQQEADRVALELLREGPGGVQDVLRLFGDSLEPLGRLILARMRLPERVPDNQLEAFVQVFRQVVTGSTTQPVRLTELRGAESWRHALTVEFAALLHQRVRQGLGLNSISALANQLPPLAGVPTSVSAVPPGDEWQEKRRQAFVPVATALVELLVRDSRKDYHSTTTMATSLHHLLEGDPAASLLDCLVRDLVEKRAYFSYTTAMARQVELLVQRLRPPAGPTACAATAAALSALRERSKDPRERLILLYALAAVYPGMPADRGREAARPLTREVLEQLTRGPSEATLCSLAPAAFRLFALLSKDEAEKLSAELCWRIVAGFASNRNRAISDEGGFLSIPCLSRMERTQICERLIQQFIQSTTLRMDYSHQLKFFRALLRDGDSTLLARMLPPLLTPLADGGSYYTDTSALLRECAARIDSSRCADLLCGIIQSSRDQATTYTLAGSLTEAIDPFVARLEPDDEVRVFAAFLQVEGSLKPGTYHNYSLEVVRSRLSSRQLIRSPAHQSRLAFLEVRQIIEQQSQLLQGVWDKKKPSKGPIRAYSPGIPYRFEQIVSQLTPEDAATAYADVVGRLAKLNSGPVANHLTPLLKPLADQLSSKQAAGLHGQVLEHLARAIGPENSTQLAHALGLLGGKLDRDQKLAASAALLAAQKRLRAAGAQSFLAISLKSLWNGADPSPARPLAREAAALLLEWLGKPDFDLAFDGLASVMELLEPAEASQLAERVAVVQVERVRNLTPPLTFTSLARKLYRLVLTLIGLTSFLPKEEPVKPVSPTELQLLGVQLRRSLARLDKSRAARYAGRVADLLQAEMKSKPQVALALAYTLSNVLSYLNKTEAAAHALRAAEALLQEADSPGSGYGAPEYMNLMLDRLPDEQAAVLALKIVRKLHEQRTKVVSKKMPGRGMVSAYDLARYAPILRRVPVKERSKLIGDTIRPMLSTYTYSGPSLPVSPGGFSGDYLGTLLPLMDPRESTEMVRRRAEELLAQLIKSSIDSYSYSTGTTRGIAALCEFLPEEMTERIRQTANRELMQRMLASRHSDHSYRLPYLAQALMEVNSWGDGRAQRRVAEGIVLGHAICVADNSTVSGQLALQLASLSQRLPLEQIVELLRHPICVGQARLVVLVAVNRRLRREFRDSWELLGWLEKQDGKGMR